MKIFKKFIVGALISMTILIPALEAGGVEITPSGIKLSSSECDNETLKLPFFEAINTGISNHFKTHPFQFVFLSAFLGGGVIYQILQRAQGKAFLANNTLVGMVEVKGFIGDANDYIEQLQMWEQNPYAKAIMLDIDSPGGYAGVDAAVANEIKRIKAIKPIVANIGKGCCSAAYYIASACDYIVAPENAAVGSIGTYFEVSHHEETPNFYMFGPNGVTASKTNVESFGGGKYKTLGDPFKKLTDDDREYLQARANENYEIFSDTVAENRGLDVEEKELWGDAQVFTGKKALELKLIDKVGSISDTKEVLKELITKRGVETKGEVVMLKFEKPKSWIARLFCLEGGTKSLSEFISDVVVKTKNKLDMFKKEKNMLLS